jgi:NADPH-dependent 2,4-dienoyl-CoA reductase/sulfur reductase-like enzyme
MKVVIIGGGAAGMSCASRIKALRPEFQVSVFEGTSFVSHAPCGIPYVIEGLSEIRNLVYYPPSVFVEERGIDLYLNSEVVEVEEGELRYRKGERERKAEWDVLVFATGSLPRIPPIEGIDLEGVFSISHPKDAETFLKSVEKAEKIVIVGLGYLGVEMAEALSMRGKKVTVLEMLDHPLPNFDREIAEVLREEMEKKVELRLSEKLHAFEGKERVEKVVSENDEFEADLVLLATGVKPNVELASTFVKLGVTGAIEVDEHMRTSVENVYAVGDCAETWHLITKRRVWIPLAPYANKMGYVAGINICGGDLKFPGVLGTQIIKFYDLQIGRTGLNEKEAEKSGFRVKSTFIISRSRPKYYPGGREIYLKLICDEETKKLLGAQIAGYESVLARVNAVAIALQSGFSVRDLFFSDIPYAPPLSTVWDPLIIASRRLGIER